jgi:hypothetical protein
VTSTSIAAALSVDTSALEELVYQAILDTKDRGAIADELRRAYPTLAYSSITARFFNLEKQGRIYRPGITRRGDSGRAQQVMWADKYTQRVSDRLRRRLGL